MENYKSPTQTRKTSTAVILLPNHTFCIYEAFKVNIFHLFPGGSDSYSLKGEFSKTLVLTKHNKYVVNVIFTPKNGKNSTLTN